MTTLILSESFKTFLNNNWQTVFANLLLNGQGPDVTKCNYITIRKGEKITYHPNPENQQFNENGDWKREGRQEVKPKALIRMLFGEELANKIDNSEFELIASSIKTFGRQIEMSTVHPEKALSREFMSGWVRTSCMSEKQFAIDFYTEHSDIFKFYKFTANGETIGRSIKVKHNEGEYFDRVYFKREEHENMIIDYLLENSHVCKKYQGNSSKRSFQRKLDGKTIYFEQDVYINIDICEGDQVPYMDTLTYYNDQGQMTNNDADKIFTFDATDGEFAVNSFYCADTCEYVTEEYAVYCDRGTYQGDYIHSDNSRYYFDETIHCDDVTYIDRYNEYYLNEQVIYSDYEGEDIVIDEAVYSDYLNTYLWADRAKEIDGDYYPTDDVVYSEYHKSDVYVGEVIRLNGDWIKKDHVDKYLETIKE